MDQPGSLICWNCGKRTDPGNCIYCKVEILSPYQVQEDKIQKKHIIEIRKRGRKVLQLDLDNLSEIVAQHFTIKNSLLMASPEFLVVNPGANLGDCFSNLVDDSSNLLDGLTPKITSVKGSTTDLIIKYIYIEPAERVEVRKILLFIIFTYMSALFAGLYNYTRYTRAQGKELSHPTIFNISISMNSIAYAVVFASIIIIILFIKDFIQIYTAFRSEKIKLSTYFLPAPPIFEIGTLGSFLHQRGIHQTRKSLFYTVLFGPIFGWLVSSAIILFSLHLAIQDPSAANSYASHSIVAKGSFEPLGLNFLANLANSLGLWNGDLSKPITQQYLLHPITIAGLAGFYICGLNLLPAAHLNGGYLVRAKFSQRIHRILTYLVIIIIISVHWLVAILLLLLNDRFGTPEILNEESIMPKTTRYWFIIAMIIAVLSFPVRI